MTQEEKDLLLKDLCGRLTCDVKAFLENKSDIGIVSGISRCPDGDIYVYCRGLGTYDLDEIKPYLFPLSSMTNEQQEELYILLGNESVGFQHYDNAFLDKDGYSEVSMISILKGIDWLNANHFDYRGLIEKSLALDATNLNIY